MGRESSIDETILRKILADGNIQIDGRVDGVLRNYSEQLRTILYERNYDEFRIGRVFQRFPDFRLMITRKCFILIRDATLMDFIDG